MVNFVTVANKELFFLTLFLIGELLFEKLYSLKSFRKSLKLIETAQQLFTEKYARSVFLDQQ